MKDFKIFCLLSKSMTFTHCVSGRVFDIFCTFFVMEKEKTKGKRVIFLTKEDNRFLIKFSVDYTEKNRKYIRFCSVRQYLI